MTQEQKELLIKDLCTRLPYGVKALYENKVFNIDHISATYEEIKLDIPDNYTIDISEVKPYLFPLESMTEEQEKELYDELIELELKALNDEISHIEVAKFEIDYYLKNHFDYRGLISMDLAIDATGLNIY